jgi:hypothetical protein
MACAGRGAAIADHIDSKNIKSSPKTYETYYVSPPIDSALGPSFLVCDNITQASQHAQS